MKKLFGILCFFCLLITVTLCFCACGDSDDSRIIYELSEDKTYYKAVGAKNKDVVDLEIASTYKGLPVSAISSLAFSDCIGIKSVIIPDSIISIGKGAFYGCNSIESIKLPFVGGEESGCFGYIFSSGSPSNSNVPSSLKNVTVFGCDSIERHAFSECANIVNVEILGNTSIISELAFSDCESLECITLCESISTIGSHAFNNCNSLSKVIISDLSAWCGIEFDGYAANPLVYAKKMYIKGNDSYIVNLQIPNNVSSISSYAFAGCESFDSINIPQSVTKIESGAFYGCNSVKSITVPFVGESQISASKAYFGSIFEFDISYSKVNTCVPSSLESVTVTGGGLANSAFENCSSISTIELPASVNIIPENAFSGCSSLSTVNIPDSVSKIGNKAFCECSSLSSIVLPSSLVDIEQGAFLSCTSLLRIDIPDSVKSISKDVFAGCTFLTQVTLPSGIEAIEDYTFYKCSSLASISIPAGVTTIGARAFQECTKLSDVTLPSGLVKIYGNAFAGCQMLYNIKIPSTVNWLSAQIFDNCTSLSSVEFENPTGWEHWTIYGTYKPVSGLENASDAAEMLKGDLGEKWWRRQ